MDLNTKYFILFQESINIIADNNFYNSIKVGLEFGNSLSFKQFLLECFSSYTSEHVLNFSVLTSGSQPHILST
jgi:hypothetical protein